MGPEPVRADVVAGAQLAFEPGVGFDGEPDGIGGLERLHAETAAPEAGAFGPEDAGGALEALGDDAGEFRDGAGRAHEAPERARLRGLVEEHGRDVAVAHGLHQASEAFAARDEFHAETLAALAHPAFGGRLVERTVDHGPIAFRELGADERRHGHHLHQREMGDE